MGKFKSVIEICKKGWRSDKQRLTQV